MKNANIKPDLKEFRRLSKKFNLIPMYAEVIADQVTPVSLMGAHWKKNERCFLLESVEGGERLGRYSIVGFSPVSVFEERLGKTVEKNGRGQTLGQDGIPALDALKKKMKRIRPAPIKGLPRFFGGAIGYCSYETARNIEVLPKTNPDKLGWPDALFYLADDLFVFDSAQQTLKISACVKIEKGENAERAYKAAVRRIRGNIDALKAVSRTALKPRIQKAVKNPPPFKTNLDKKAFGRLVARAKEHILAGDIIQVVLSRRSERKTVASPLDIYRALRVVNPSPYMYLLKNGDQSIIGSSPESLVRLEEGEAMTRPIAGTRRRGLDEKRDAAMEKELMNDPKEIAEHIMLVDLGRNDLGRVCDYGKVSIPRFMEVEKYSHVMHIVSEVIGKLKKGKDGFDLIKAVFPAGTVSGAPKIRAMEIIDALENLQRGPYAGALGYISYSGNLDLAITIRTILWNKGKASIQAGAGIVADSDPKKEFLETENKAAAMKKTIELAESGDMFLEKA